MLPMKLATTDATLRLNDGRSLGYLEVGKSDGPAIFHFHGHASSRLEVVLLAEAAQALGVRLIGLDRPGIGTSTPKPGAKILDWPDDVVQVAELLGIEEFAVEGVSDGGTYALACAYKISKRLKACGLISTVTPMIFLGKAGPLWMRGMWWVAEHFPKLFRSYIHMVSRNTNTDVVAMEKELLRYGPFLADADKKLLHIPEMRQPIAQAMAESRRQGVQANREEAIIGVQPWGFQVEQIACQNIFLWHGEQDRIMPIASARLLAQALPHCIATFYPTEGHFSTLVNHASDILKTLRI